MKNKRLLEIPLDARNEILELSATLYEAQKLLELVILDCKQIETDETPISRNTIIKIMEWLWERS